MTLKKLIGTVFMTALAVGVFCFHTAFAAETVLYDEEINNVYEKDGLSINWWGKQDQNPEYARGERWATAWGGEGWYSDAEDGALAIHAKVGVTGEMGVGKKIVADPLPKNSAVEFTLGFRTPQTGGQSGQTEVWFTSGSIKLFQYKNTPQNPEFGFASTTNWPFTAKSFDRDPDNMKLEYGKEYTMKITVKPGMGEGCKVVVDLFSSDNIKLATGIIDDWQNIKPDDITNITDIGFNATVVQTAKETEPSIFIKHLAVKGIYEVQKPEAEFYPHDSSTQNKIDTECYVQFKRAVKDVTEDDVTISPSGSVKSVTMIDGKKAVIALDGLKANTKYTVNVKNVSEENEEKSFDYSWSFSTGGSAEFKKPYFGTSSTLFSQSMNSFDISSVVSLEDDAFKNGEAWGTNILDNAGTAYEVSYGYLWTRGVLNDTLSRRFTPINDGETLKITTTLKLSNYARDNTGAAIKLSSSANAAENYTLLRFSQIWSGLALDTLSKNQHVNPGTDENGTGVAWRNRGWWHLSHSEEGQDAGLEGELQLTLTLKPDTQNADMYNAYVTLKGRKEYTAEVQIAKSVVMGLDTIVFQSETTSSDATGASGSNFMGISELEIISSDGEDSMQLGSNTAYIDYINLDETEVFDADVLIIEHKKSEDGGFGKVMNVTVVSNKDLTGSDGKLVCPFELTDAESTVEFYVLNNIEDGILLSEGTSMTVE